MARERLAEFAKALGKKHPSLHPPAPSVGVYFTPGRAHRYLLSAGGGSNTAMGKIGDKPVIENTWPEFVSQTESAEWIPNWLPIRGSDARLRTPIVSAKCRVLVLFCTKAASAWFKGETARIYRKMLFYVKLMAISARLMVRENTAAGRWWIFMSHRDLLLFFQSFLCCACKIIWSFDFYDWCWWDMSTTVMKRLLMHLLHTWFFS